MAGPIRHPNHVLETECNKYFLCCIPNEWCCDKPEHDYGIDYIVNIAINNRITGLNFSVQLKSMHETPASAASVSITLKQSTLNLYNARLEPIMLIVYSQADKEAYWVWYNDLHVNLTRNRKTHKIIIPKENRLGLMEWNDVVGYVKNIFSVKFLIDGIRQLEYDELTDTEVLAWKNYYQKEYENAGFYFKRALKERPMNLSLKEALAHSLYMERKYDEALIVVDELIARSATDHRLLLKASILTEDGLCRHIKSRVLEAKRIFRRLLDRHSEPAYHYNYANALSYLGEYDEAIKYYKLALSKNPNYAEAWKNLGGVYNKLHRHQEEIKCYDKALSIDPNLPQALFSKGIALSRVYGRHAEAVGLMESALTDERAMMKDYPHGYFWLAYTNEKLGDLRKAYDWMNKGLDIVADDHDLLNLKCHFLSNHWMKDHWIKEEAEFFFETMVSTYNDYRSLYYYILIKKADNATVIDLVHKYVSQYNRITLQDIEVCFRVEEFTKILLHYGEYLLFREKFPINRYLPHLISGNFTIQTKFWDMLDLIFGYSFSCYVEHYCNCGSEKMDEVLLDKLSVSSDAIFWLIEPEKFSTQDISKIMAEIFVGFPTVVVREYGAQKGYVAQNLGLPIDNSSDACVLPKDWFELFERATYEKTATVLKGFHRA